MFLSPVALNFTANHWSHVGILTCQSRALANMLLGWANTHPMTALQLLTQLPGFADPVRLCADLPPSELADAKLRQFQGRGNVTRSGGGAAKHQCHIVGNTILHRNVSDAFFELLVGWRIYSRLYLCP